MPARVARYALPGPMYWIAVCEECRLMDMSWKDRGWATSWRDKHNAEHHARLLPTTKET